MRRYLSTALTIGSAVAAVVLMLYFAGAFEAMVTWLGGLYGLSGIFPGEAVRIRWLEIPLIAVTAVGMAWWVIDVPRPFQKMLIALSGAVVLAGISPTIAFHGYLVDPFSSLAAALLSSVAAFAYAGTERGLRKRVLEEVLGQRVSSAVFHELLEGPRPPDFKGATREVTVLTCRLINYERLQAALDPSELVKLSNLFIRSASTFLLSRGGYLDESGPEAVRVSFGALTPSGNHAAEACRAALEWRGRLRNLSQECENPLVPVAPMRGGDQLGAHDGRRVWHAGVLMFSAGFGEVNDFVQASRSRKPPLRFGHSYRAGDLSPFEWRDGGPADGDGLRSRDEPDV